MNKINIIGAGLAGCEAALYLAEQNWQVKLFEMRPEKMTEAHSTGNFAELVCSNSLKSKLHTSASGLLKTEMELLGSKLLEIAKAHEVPAGNALAVNREKFGEKVTEIIDKHPNIEVIRKEVEKIDDELTILATGPLTSKSLLKEIMEIIDEKHLYFFDAIAPIVEADSLDYEKIFRKSRRDKGDADYLNCPFTKEEYYNFVEALKNAEKHEAHEFENEFFEQIDFNFYQNCTPIEELARRGEDTLAYGVIRPVGLEDPETGKRYHAVLQLRTEDRAKSAYNLVGCQTMMKYGEQKRVFRMIPGLENVEFLRYGSIHKNAYLNGGEVLNQNLSLKNKPNVFVAGQLSGVEGYVESIFSGLLIAKILNKELVDLPETTVGGQLWRYLTTKIKDFQPMNANFGLLPNITMKKKNKRLKKKLRSERAVKDLKDFLEKK